MMEFSSPLFCKLHKHLHVHYSLHVRPMIMSSVYALLGMDVDKLKIFTNGHAIQISPFRMPQKRSKIPKLSAGACPKSPLGS